MAAKLLAQEFRFLIRRSASAVYTDTSRYRRKGPPTFLIRPAERPHRSAPTASPSRRTTELLGINLTCRTALVARIHRWVSARTTSASRPVKFPIRFILVGSAPTDTRMPLILATRARLGRTTLISARSWESRTQFFRWR